MEYRLIHPYDAFFLLECTPIEKIQFLDSLLPADQLTFAYPEGVIDIGRARFSLGGITYIETVLAPASPEALEGFKIRESVTMAKIQGE